MSQSKQNPLRTADSVDVYKEALDRVLAELADLKQQKNDIIARELQLHQSIKALKPLAGSLIPDVSHYTLSNAVRLVFRGLPAGQSMGAIEVRAKLEELGYELSGYENPLANIHTCMRRMHESEEIVTAKSDDNKKKFEAGPELKQVPDPDETEVSAEITEGRDE